MTLIKGAIMTYDGPYRVSRVYRPWSGESHIYTYRIERSGEDAICYCDDVTYAYRLVDLLNEEHREKRIAADDRRLHQGGDAPLASAAE